MAEPFLLNLPEATGYKRPPTEKFGTRRTHYYSDNQLVDLDMVKMKLTSELRQEIDKSELMQLALDVLIEEVEVNGAMGLFGQRQAAMKQARAAGRTKLPATKSKES